MAERNPDGTFAKGYNGGPGRPKSPRRIEGILQRIGQEEVLCEGGEIKTRLERLMNTVYSLAEDGQQWAVQFVAERTEGKIREAQVEQSESAVPIKILDMDAVQVDGD